MRELNSLVRPIDLLVPTMVLKPEFRPINSKNPTENPEPNPI